MSPDALAERIERGEVLDVAAALRGSPGLVAGTTADGDTPLHIACWQKQMAIVGIILGYQPPLDALGCYGRTALHYAVHEGGWSSVPIVGALLAAGADPLLRDGNGFGVDEWAKIQMIEGLAEVLDLLGRWRRDGA